jgi:integrase
MHIPGSFYQRSGRWYWRIRLPGEPKTRCIALRPKGHTRAVTDRAVAEQVARSILRAHTAPPADRVRTLYDLCGMYEAWADGYYFSQEPSIIRYALAPLKARYGRLPPEDFGPRKLKHLQKEWETGGTVCRKQINRRIDSIKRMFKWAASEELVDVSIYQALQTVAGLRKGRTPAMDHPPRHPVAWADVEAVFPFTSPHVAAMIRLGWLTGMRPEEICLMTPAAIDRAGPVWLYTPSRHKMSYRSQVRRVYLGPQAQAVLTPYLDRPPEAFCFDPKESEVWRAAQKRAGRQTPRYGKRAMDTAPRVHAAVGDRYTTAAFGKAVRYAQLRAGAAGVALTHWTPYQLRHARADSLRTAEGLDVVAAVLGHKDITTSQLYAQLDAAKAIAAAAKYG